MLKLAKFVKFAGGRMDVTTNTAVPPRAQLLRVLVTFMDSRSPFVIATDEATPDAALFQYRS